MREPFDPNRVCRMCLNTNIKIAFRVNRYTEHRWLSCACLACGYEWEEDTPSTDQYEIAKEEAERGPSWKMGEDDEGY